MLTWQFYRQRFNRNGIPIGAAPVLAGRSTFQVAAIVDVPPALSDVYDQASAAILTPAATKRYLAGQFAFAWVALRLKNGSAGVPALRSWLGSLAAKESAHYSFPVNFLVRQMVTVERNAQEAIRPQVLALAVLSGIVALAMLVLSGQGIALIIGRSAPQVRVLRMLGMTRAQAAFCTAGLAAIAVVGALVLSVAGALALSPMGPVGPVRTFDPLHGVHADWVVLSAGSATLLLLLASEIGLLAWRAVRRGRELAPPRPSAIVLAASKCGLPVAVVTGMRFAVESGPGRTRVPVRATLAGAAAATSALVAALVFSASLSGLVHNPSRYGWNWTLLVQSQGGWGGWSPSEMAALVHAQPGVTGWSEFGFGQLGIGGQVVPVIGLRRHPGVDVAPPTTSGHQIAGPNQIELGAVTMRQLGTRLGEHIVVSSGQRTYTLDVVGTVTLPSFGVSLTDHVSLGRGAMIDESTLLTMQHLSSTSNFRVNTANPAIASAAAFDLASTGDARQLAARIIKAEPDQTPGGIYRLWPQKGAQIVNFSQMGSQPLTLAIAVAVGAVIAIALAVIVSVRARLRELALLKSLGLRRRQIRAIVASQVSTVLAAALLIGLPFGALGGRWAWIGFAGSIGVVPTPVIPVTALIIGVAALAAGGAVLASWPAAIAARTKPAGVLRAE